jgi:stage V sporulation protein B
MWYIKFKNPISLFIDMLKIPKYFSKFSDLFNKEYLRGNTGIAIRNSVYDFSNSLLSKGGSLIFTILMARILMPELFGLYSLALSTIILFVTFSEFGLSQTSIKFISYLLGKKRKKQANAYANYLIKIKLIVVSASALLLILSARFFEAYYQKPIFLALIGGVFYLFTISLTSFVQAFFQAANDFKTIFYRSLVFEIIRIILLPLLSLYLVKNVASQGLLISIILLCLGFTWLLTLFFLVIVGKKKLDFLNFSGYNLKLKEKETIKKFIIGISIFNLINIIFGFIDIFLLGRFGSSLDMGYYQVALGFINALSFLLLFSNALFPIFSRLEGKKLDDAFKKSSKVIFFISIFLFLIVFFLVNKITLIYGKEYSGAIPVLRILSFLLMITPLSTLYTGFFVVKKEIKSLIKLLIISIFFFIIFGFLLVYLHNYFQLTILLAIAITTTLSKLFYLSLLVLKNYFLTKKYNI